MNTDFLIPTSRRTSISDHDDWLADGRLEIKERLEDSDEEYREYLKEECPYVYWGWEFTPEPPEEVARALGLD